MVWIPGENSNKVGIWISRILEFGKAWKNSTRRFRRNLEMGIFPKFFLVPYGFKKIQYAMPWMQP
jgi:hypothetical protein